MLTYGTFCCIKISNMKADTSSLPYFHKAITWCQTASSVGSSEGDREGRLGQAGSHLSECHTLTQEPQHRLCPYQWARERDILDSCHKESCPIAHIRQSAASRKLPVVALPHTAYGQQPLSGVPLGQRRSRLLSYFLTSLCSHFTDCFETITITSMTSLCQQFPKGRNPTTSKGKA